MKIKINGTTYPPHQEIPDLKHRQLLIQTTYANIKPRMGVDTNPFAFFLDILSYFALLLIRGVDTIIIILNTAISMLNKLYIVTKFAFFGKSKKSKFLSTNIAIFHIILLILTFLLINNLYQTAKSLNYLASTKHPPLLITQADGYLKQDLQVQILQDIQVNDTLVERPHQSTRAYFVYRVQPGDTLFTIAQKYGITTNVLIAANSISNINYLKIGQTLRVPTQNGILYRIKKGDSLLSLAKKYKIDYSKLLAANGFAKTTKIKTGQIILIPGITPTVSAPKPKPTRHTINNTYLAGSYFSGAPGSCSFALKYSGGGLRNYKVRPAIRYVKFIKYNPIAGSFRFGAGFAGYRWGTYYWHSGVDYIAAYGTPIIAVADGIVDRVGAYGAYNYGYGNYIRIYHPQVGLYTLYAHMSRYHPSIHIGSHVKAGQVIGYVGHTGIAYGSHLHFEVIDRNRLRYNPACFK